MTIRNTFPSNYLVPGVSHEQDLTSGSRAMVPNSNRLLVLATKTSGGLAVADTPTQVFGEADADRLAGAGSPAAIMLRAAMATARSQGTGAPEFWLAGIAAPGGGTAASNGTLVVTGTTTAAGSIKFSIAGVRFDAAVASGSNATACAAAMATAVTGKLSQIPGTTLAATGTLTYTHNVAGVTGNDVQLRVESTPPGISIAATQPTNGAGALTYTTALANALAQDYDMLVFESHTSTETSAALTHLADAWIATRKRWRMCVFGERGSVSTCTTLATAANDPRVILVASPDSPALPGVLAAAVATMLLTRDSPVYNHNKTKLPAIPPTLITDELIDSEIQTLLAGGCTPITLDEDRTGVSMVQTVVTTKKTEGGNPFLDLLFVGNIRAVIWSMRQCDARVAQIMKNRNVDAALVRDIKGGIYDILKAGERLNYLHNVDAHAAEILAEADPDQPTRVITAIPECPVPIANQTHNVHRMYVEAPV